MTRLKLKQLAIDNASDSQLIKYDATSGLWEYATNITAASTGNNKGETSLATTGDDQDTGVTIDEAPIQDSYVTVYINGISYTLGDGVTTEYCYFNDGVGASEIENISDGYSLYWNGDIAGFDLTTDDKIDLDYNISIPGSTGGLVNPLTILIEKKTITSATDSVVFTGLDGDTDILYYCTYKIKNDGAGDAIYKLQPNQSTSLVKCSEFNGYGTTAYFNYYDYCKLGICSASNYVFGDFHFHADKSNNNVRSYLANVGYIDNGSTWSSSIGGGWYDKTTNITSLEFVSDIANGIGVDSEIVLYKILRS